MRALGVEGDEEWEEAAEVEIRNIAEKRKFLSEMMTFFQVGKVDISCESAFPKCPKSKWLQILEKENEILIRAQQ